MLVEPPGPHVPARHSLIASPLRLALAAAALVLAVLSRGDALVLAGVLALAVWRPVPAVALAAGLVASSWRWGSTSLEALAGDQAVLGPAGWVGPTSAAAASWLAAVALVVGGTGARLGRLRTPNRELGAPGQLAAASMPRTRGWGHQRRPERPLRPEPQVEGTGARPGRLSAPNLEALARVVLALAAGAAAAAVVAGPAPGGDVWVRVVATVIAALLALGVSWLRAHRSRAGWLLDGLALLAGAAAVVAAVPEAPGWDQAVDADAVAEGLAIGLAIMLLVAAATATLRLTRARPT